MTSHADPSRPATTVFVGDDDDGVRTSLGILLDSAGYRAVAFASARDFLEQYDPARAGCLLLDMRMPGMTGMDLLHELAGRGAFLPVIFITAHADVPTAVAAMKTGAVEFLEKPFDREKLLNRVQRALDLDAEWRSQDAQFAALAARIAVLNERDRETLQMIQAGESNKAMAAKLFISERAVEMRRSSLMKKLQVSSVAELIDLTSTHRILAELNNLKSSQSLR